jgi:hypothetical protein
MGFMPLSDYEVFQDAIERLTTQCLCGTSAGDDPEIVKLENVGTQACGAGIDLF